MAQRRVKSSQDKTSSLSITIPSSLLDQINEKVEGDISYGSRSDFLEKAANFLLSAKECPYCHELTGPGNYCSFCRRDLSFTPAERSLAMELYLEQHPEHMSDGDRMVRVHLSNLEVRRLLDGEEIPSASSITVVDKKIFRERIRRIYREKRDQEKREKASITNNTSNVDDLTDDELSSIGDF